MAEVDTSSYPKPTAGKSLIEQVQGLGALQQQKQQLESNSLVIDRQKFENADKALGFMTRAMGSIGPNATKEQYQAVAQNAVRMGLVPQNMLNTYVERLNAAPTAKAFYNEFMNSAASHKEMSDYYLGQNENITDNSKVIQGVRSSPAMGGGFKPASETPLQLPPTTQNVDNNRTLPNGQPNPNYLQPGFVGPSGPPGTRPAMPVTSTPAPANQPFFQGEGRGAEAQPPAKAPLSALTTGGAGPTKERVDLEGTTPAKNFDDRFGGAFPNRVVTGAAPGVASAIETVGAQSGKDYASSLARARNFQADLYPAQAALHSIKELGPQAIGPGTETLNDLKRALVTWLPNVDPKTIENVSNFDQIKKYLTQVARTSGNTGTNDQLAAAFDANPNTKMSTAGVETVLKSIIALRRMDNAQTLLFNQQGLNPSEYSQWVSKNQNVFDPRAFGFIDMDRAAQNKLVKSLTPAQKKKFEYSLEFAEKAGMIEPPKLRQ